MASSVGIFVLCCAFVTLQGVNSIEKSKRAAPDLIVSNHDFNIAVKFAEDSISRLQRLENSLKCADIDVEEDSPSHGQLIESYPTAEALAHGRQAMIVNKASAYLLQRHCKRRHLSNIDCLSAMGNWSLNGTPLRQKCTIQFKTMNCRADVKYRNFDGSCNHLKHPSWGQAYSPYRRLIPAHYSDGIAEPRKSVTRRPLPSPRLISNNLVPDVDKPERETTLALAQWSQFIANDLFHTPITKMVYTGSSITCCRPDGRPLSPRYIHPACLQIAIPSDDPDYSPYRATCMNYVRSVTSLRRQCNFGAADQMNQATHYLDGSHIYGSSSSIAIGLRAMKGGRLATSGSGDAEFLPLSQIPELKCQTPDNDTICYSGGDSRVNQQPQHTALYTVWVREHNRIADYLHEINPYWDDSKLFQEARRIVIAQIQHITYNDWAPQVLGSEYATKLRLDTNYKGVGGSFSEDVDPTVSNSFATAGMSFVNSMLQRELRLYDENRKVTGSLQLRDHYNKPSVTSEPGMLDSLLRGLSYQPSQKIDASFVEDVTSQLYHGDDVPYGLDIVSLDIQKGRDHGLPGYNAMRRYCKLPSSSKFETFLDAIPKTNVNKLKALYAHPDDVDLVAGAILELPVDGGKLGPTLRCIVEEQLARTKKGDRFFYDLSGYPHAFTETQINELQKASLARVLCDNAASILQMQPDVFSTVSQSNPLMDCADASIPTINLNAWKVNTVLTD